MSRLLILSCSERKRLDPGLLPAIQRYDGPAFQVLRRYTRECPGDHGLAVYVLSAAHGMISAQQPIASYDQAMTRQRAAELRETASRSLAELLRLGFSEICLAMSARYLRVIDGWPTLVPPTASVTLATGGQGSRLRQLKAWLWQSGVSIRKPQRRVVKQGAAARLRSVEVALPADEVLQKARIAMALEDNVATSIRKWCVDVDGQLVSAKWLVSVITGLPVRVFTAGEACRLLERLGVHVYGLSVDR